jgi:Carboxypeptidase regulatory-like domain/TonB dependent receptor-like, beta-barrel
MKRLLSFLVCGGVLVMLPATNVLAQATAQITGTVKDASGGVLPGASVSATQTETGFKREVVTDADGLFSFPGIPVGPYKLEVTLQGFRTSVQTDIVLQVNSNPVVPVTLALGEIAETITVQANAQVVETRSLGVGQVMDNKRILDLPLNGRNPADLLQYLPASVPQVQVLASSTMGGSGGGQAYSVAGGLAFGVAYVLDGAMHNDPRNNLNLPLPFPDALQEFQAATSALTAQNGMHSGAAVNAVTKSGTNAFRGDLFEFFRHHSFNATDPFATKNDDGSRKDDGLKRNQYGATIGGPIKTDRLFFFFGYQGTNTTVNPTDNRAFVPTDAMLAGDFTAFASPACNAGVQRNLGAPFVGNRVSPALFSKAALNITSRLPTTTDPCGLLQYGLPSATDEGQYVTKIDYTFNNRHTLFGRYIATTQFSPPPFTLASAQQNVLATRIGGRDNKANSFTLGENYVISSSTLNAVRFAYNRTNISRPDINFFSAPEVGINSYSYLQHYMLLTVTGGFTLGTGTETPTNIVTPSWQISDDLTLVRGGHQYVVGGSFARWSTESHGNVRSPGQFTIDGTQTGLGLADFLLGKMGTNALVQAAPNTLDMRQAYVGLYAQDTWRVGPRLTLNYGVRWEPFFPQQLVNGAVYQFDMARFRAGTKSTVFPNAPAGLYFPGDPGFPSQAGMPTDWNNLGPRVGLAWDPLGDGKTSVRASYGKSYEFVNGQFHLNTSVAPPWGSEVRLNAPPGGLDNPFLGNPGGQTNIFPVTFDQNATFSLNGPFLSLTNSMESTSVHSFNVTVERQLAGRWFASAGYIGSRTSNIWESTPLNNAVFGPVPGTNAAPSIANTNNRRPLNAIDPSNGKYYAALDQYVSDGSQRFNGLLLSVRGGTRLTTVNANYTLSHCYGSPEGGGASTTNVSVGYNIPSNPGFDDGNCAADRLHNFSLTASVQSPRLDNRAMRTVFSDWRLVGGYRKTTGPWLTVNTGADIALNGQAGTQRANQVLDDPYADMSINPANGAMRFLNPAAFAQPAAGTLGTSARNGIRGMGTRSLDLSLTRVIRVAGTQDVEVRVDAFNAFNWFQWGQPSTALNNLATFGQITSAGAPRAMQFAIKYRF